MSADACGRESGMGATEAPARPLVLGSCEFHAALADLLRHAGTAAFYDEMARLVAGLVDCQKWLVMRYAAHAEPVFIVNRAMSERACAYYLKGLYRLDPLNKIARSRPKATVININQAGSKRGADDEYLNELFRSAFIYDELAVLLPAPGGITVAVCCERRRRRFADTDIAVVHSILEMLDATHQVHISRAFNESLGAHAETVSLRQEDAILILDERGGRVFATDKWRLHEEELGYFGQLIEQAAERETGQLNLNRGLVLTWERLGREFALAPMGRFLTISREAPDPLRVSAREAVATFQDLYGLTPREVEIVELALKSYANERIADALGISIGTVKNHRWRLYLKLDITSERELFYLFLSAVLDIDVDTGRTSPKRETASAL